MASSSQGTQRFSLSSRERAGDKVSAGIAQEQPILSAVCFTFISVTINKVR